MYALHQNLGVFIFNFALFLGDLGWNDPIFKTIFEYIHNTFRFVHTTTFCKYRRKLSTSPRVHLVYITCDTFPNSVQVLVRLISRIILQVLIADRLTWSLMC